MVFWLALQGVLGLLLISLVGYVLVAKGWFDAHAIITMPRLITCVALPPYLFYTVSHSFQRDQLLHMIYGSLIPFVSMLLTFALAYLLARLFRVKEARRGLFCTGMSASNTMYIGLPVNLALFGDEALPFVLLYFLPIRSFSGRWGTTPSAMTRKSSAPRPVCSPMRVISFPRP